MDINSHEKLQFELLVTCSVFEMDISGMRFDVLLLRRPDWIHPFWNDVKGKGKLIPVTCRGGPQGCERLRLLHFLDNRLRDGGGVVCLTRRPPFTLRKNPGTHLCLRLSRPQGHSASGRIRSTEKSNYLIGNQTRDLPACSIVPQPTTLPRVKVYIVVLYIDQNIFVMEQRRLYVSDMLPLYGMNVLILITN
jgi:hypothetical protein